MTNIKLLATRAHMTSTSNVHLIYTICDVLLKCFSALFRYYGKPVFCRGVTPLNMNKTTSSPSEFNWAVVRVSFPPVNLETYSVILTH